MALETGTFVDDLVTTNPVGATDLKSQGDDHLRLIKATLKNTFPNATKAFRFEEVTSVKTAAYSVVASDARKLIPVDTSGGAFSVTLLAAATAGAGFVCTILQTVNSTNLITVDAAGVETINGATTITLNTQYESVHLWSDGTKWYALYSERDNDSFESKSADYTALKTDKGKSIRFTAVATLSLTAAATLGDGWWIDVIDETGVTTIDPNGSETIDGAATLALSAAYSCRIKCNGTAFYTQFLYTPTKLGLVIGTDVQAYNSRLDIYNNAHIFVATGGSASVYTLTPNIPATIYNLNDLYLIRLNHSATLATSTINIDGLGAINIEYRNAAGTKVVAPASVLLKGMFMLLKLTTAGATAEIIQSTHPFGVAAYNAVQLDSAAKLPAVDGSLLTGVAGVKSIQAFTANGTWIRPAGVTKVMIEVTGGGQGGDSVSAGVPDPVSGGNCGGTAVAILDVSAISFATITVGAAGAANLGNGGNSSWSDGTNTVRGEGGGTGSGNLGFDVEYGARKGGADSASGTAASRIAKCPSHVGMDYGWGGTSLGTTGASTGGVGGIGLVTVYEF